jgi:hypothetical protein
MFSRLFRKSFTKISSIREEDCLELFSKEELYQLVRSFQAEKRYLLNLYLECLEQQLNLKGNDKEVERLETERIQYWKGHMHYEKLVQWIFGELEHRNAIKPGNN